MTSEYGLGILVGFVVAYISLLFISAYQARYWKKIGLLSQNVKIFSLGPSVNKDILDEEHKRHWSWWW